MPATKPGGMATEFAVDVRKKDGTLFYHEATIPIPEIPEHPQFPSCPSRIDEYKEELDYWVEWCKKKADYYKALHDYHSARCAYCMRHKNDNIKEKYKTGEPQPQTIEEAKEETIKLREE